MQNLTIYMKIINKHIILILIIFNSLPVLSQIKITGKIVDASLNPVESVEILLYSSNKTWPQIEYTDAKGYFSSQVSPGAFFIQIRQLGKSLYTDSLIVNENLDLGTIQVDPIHNLEEITITGQKKLVEIKGDRLVFNVENSIMATGNSAMEVLKNSPRINPFSETLAILGKSSVQVMVNDRLLELTGNELNAYLQSLRSENIAKVEIITSPPSKYDAAGNSGLINIILKKNINRGFDGSATFRFFHGQRPGYLASSNMSYSTGRLNVNLNLNGNIENSIHEIETEMKYPSYTRKSVTERDMKPKNGFVALRADYQLSNKSNFGITLNVSTWEYKTNDNTDVTFRKSEHNIDSTQYTFLKGKQNSTYFSASAYYDVQLDSMGKKMKFNYNYLTNNKEEDRIIRSEFYTGEYDILGEKSSDQNISESKYRVNSVNADIELPFKAFKMEAGGKFSYFNNHSDIQFYNLTYGIPELDPQNTNIFDYDEQISAAYFSVEKNIKKWYLRAGLRYEYAYTKGNSLCTDQTFSNSFSDLFPSFSLSHTADKHAYSLGYAKRINRPSFNHVNPFRVYWNLYNYIEGNPHLEPSIMHNLEFTYVLRNNFTVSPYVSLLKNEIGYVTLSNQNDPVIITKPLNYIETKSAGIQISYNLRFGDHFSSFNSLNGSYAYTKSDLPEITIDENSGYSCTYITRNTLTINKKNNHRIYANYTHSFKELFLLTEMSPRANLRIGGVFAFWDKKLNVDIFYSDVFRQFGSKTKERYIDFILNGKNYYDNQYFNISLTYSFGNSKSKSINRHVDTSESGRF